MALIPSLSVLLLNPLTIELGGIILNLLNKVALWMPLNIILLTVLLMPGTPYRQISLAIQQLQHLNRGCYNTISHPI